MMAMRTASNASAHAKSSSTGSAGSVPYALPASPTLTNPDMILPDYDDRASSPDRSQSPIMMWKNNNQFDLHSQSFQAAPITPTTPIIYGNGTMLSDIGEVTEAESTTGPMRSLMTSRSAYDHSHATTREYPVTSTYGAVKKKKSEQGISTRDRERRLSMESTSTITNTEQEGMFADFDDRVSVDDSVFQGDDEDSVAESYIYDNGSDAGDKTPPAHDLTGRLDPSEEERYSTALSRRAEQILANAKRRLTTMEGNLNRARSTLSPVNSTSTPSPPFARPSTAIHRNRDPEVFATPHGHNRISSENNIPNDVKSPSSLYSPRSSSALGAAGGYRQPLQISRSADYMREIPKQNSPSNGPVYGNPSFSKSKSSLHEIKHTLEPLGEDDVGEDIGSPRDSLGSTKLDTFLSPTFGSFNDKGLKRSASTAQMRDIKDQMKDLKGRLSSLRDQARRDSMKRRSLQSLRTPSPFTHAREWSQDTKSEHGDSETIDKVSNWNANVETSSLHEVNDAPNEELRKDQAGNRSSTISESVYSDHDGSPQTKLSPPESHGMSPRKARLVAESTSLEDPVEGIIVDPSVEDGLQDDMDDMKTEDGYQDNDVEDIHDYASESGESDYHDTVQQQVSHEDREDAFDYEHFFLHSAMGSMSQKKLRRQSSQRSFSSEDSVETTRGPVVSRGHSRRGSDASLDSFATATEGRTTRIGHETMDELSEQVVTIPERSQSHTPDTAKRLSFGFANNRNRDSNSDESQKRISVIRRPQSSAAAFAHRPSISSMGSSGTTRSFPLVNRPKSNGVPTPRDSPDQDSSQSSATQDYKNISDTLMNETASICESISPSGSGQPIDTLQKDDQILVERLVASLGKCVLGLTESGRATTESRSFRRRIEMARRILEGLDQPF